MRSTVLREHPVRSAARRSRGWWRLLVRAGPVHLCDSCGERMYVRPASGLCPHCWNGRRPGAAVASALRAARPVGGTGGEGDEAVREVPSHLALLGVADEPEPGAAPAAPAAPAASRPAGRLRRASGILRSAWPRLRAAAARGPWRSI